MSNKIITHLSHGFNYQEPTMIVIHSMGEFIIGNGWKDHAVQYLDREGLSAHSIISPTGMNYICRNDTEGAYHAKGFNTNSLGIEYLVKGSHDYASFIEAIKTEYLSEEQYQTGKLQIEEWLNAWPIKRIVRHSDISPHRKADAGAGFPFKQLMKEIGFNEKQ